MSALRTSASSKLFGSKGHTSVSRGLAEYHARRPVLINWVNGVSETLLTLPVEGLDAQRLGEFLDAVRAGGARAHHHRATRARARHQRLDADGAAAVERRRRAFDPGAGRQYRQRARSAGDAGRSLRRRRHPARQIVARPAGRAGRQGLAGRPRCLRPEIITVDADAVARFADEAIKSLTLASEAPVPLDSGTRTRFVVFRDALGGSPVADHRRQAGLQQAGPGAPAFGLPDRRRVRLAALRLRRSAQIGVAAAGRPRRRHHPLSGAGRPRAWPRQQDAHLPDAGRGPRHGRRQHDARLRRRRARLRHRRAHAADARVHAHRAAHQQPGQARRPRQGRHRDRRPHVARNADQFRQRAAI